MKRFDVAAWFLEKLFTELLPSLDGGYTDELDFTPATVRLVGGSNVVLGTGVVVLKPNWVLTAAHIVRGRPWRVRAEHFPGQPLGTAVGLLWMSGMKYAFDGTTKWPPEASSLGGERDELLLIEFDRSLVDDEDCAAVAMDHLPRAGEPVLYSGYGRNGDGVYEPKRRIGLMRYAGLCSNNRAACWRDPRLIAESEPRKDDSGAPVFQPDFGRFGLQRVVGIHTSRAISQRCPSNLGRPPDEVISRFIPVRESESKWIESSTNDSFVGPLANAFAGSDVCLRLQFHCRTFETPSELSGTWHLIDVPHPLRLRTKDRVEISGDDHQAVMKVFRCDAAPEDHVFEIKLSPVQISSGKGWHWLESGLVDGLYWYVFLRTDCYVGGVKKRRIRLEVFLEDSPHSGDRPSTRNVSDSYCRILDDNELPLRGPCEDFVRGGELDDDDQDDEGEGYED